MIERKYESIEVLAVLLKHKWVIIIFTLALTIASVFYALNIAVQYKSTVNVVPPSKTAGGALSGALSGITSKLKDFGITKVGGSGENGQSYDLSVLIESRTVLDTMIKEFDLINSYKTENNSLEITRKILSSNIEMVNYKEGNIELTIWDTNPQKAAKMANRFIQVVNEKAAEMSKTETSVNIKYLEKRIANNEDILNRISDSLAFYSKKYQIFSPEDQATVFSEVLADLNAAVMKAETEYQISKNKLGENDPYTQMLKDYVVEAKKKLNEAKTTPGLIGNFSLNNVSKVGMEYMRLYTDYEAHLKLKLFLMPTLEKSKLDMLNKSKYLYVVDNAVPAEHKDRPKRSFIVLGTFAGSFILSVMIVLIINGFNNLKERLRTYKESV